MDVLLGGFDESDNDFILMRRNHPVFAGAGVGLVGCPISSKQVPMGNTARPLL